MEVTKLTPKLSKHWHRQASAPQSTVQEIELHNIITREQEIQRKETEMNDYTADNNKRQDACISNNAIQYISNNKNEKEKEKEMQHSQ